MVGSSCQVWSVTIAVVLLFGAPGNLEGSNRNLADTTYSENAVLWMVGSFIYNTLFLQFSLYGKEELSSG